MTGTFVLSKDLRVVNSSFSKNGVQNEKNAAQGLSQGHQKLLRQNVCQGLDFTFRAYLFHQFFLRHHYCKEGGF